MSSAEFVFKVDLNDKALVLKWRNILDYLAKDDVEPIESGAAHIGAPIDESAANALAAVNSANVPSAAAPAHSNVAILRRFMAEGSENQKKVLEWMKQNPGRVPADELKRQFPFLKPHGALSGVFRTERWVKHLKGAKETCPFKQVEWDRAGGFGIYRGIAAEEADQL